MAETGLQGNFRSPIGARLEGIEAEYKRLQEERDQAIRERDEAREAWKPFLQEIEDLRARVLAVVPKDRRLPSAKTRGTRMITGRPGQPSEETVDGWAEQYEGGMSLTRIAQSSKAKAETIKSHLEARGIEVRGKRPFAHGVVVVAHRAKKEKAEETPRCKECGLALDSPALTNSNVPAPVDGVCGLCQFIANDLAGKRAGKAA